MATIPHFSLPLRFDKGRAVVRQQDGIDEIRDCVMAICLCPKGFRYELPEFGIDDPTFSQTVPESDDIISAIAEWEPRAQINVTTIPDSLDELISYVTVAVGEAPPNQPTP